MRNLADLPKAHLHLHVGMGMRPSTFVELGSRLGRSTALPSGDDMTLASFAPVGDTLQAILSTPDNWLRFYHELLADHAEEGAIYVEPSLPLGVYGADWPSEEHFLVAMIEMAGELTGQYGVRLSFMIPIDRSRDSPERASALAHLAARYQGQGVVSLGLHGDEAAGGAMRFAGAFDIAHAAGVLVTPHAGETAGPPSIEATLASARPHRIQHGVTCIQAPGLVDRLAADSICLDVCPTSNQLLGVTASLAENPLGLLVDKGVPCSLNADDPLAFQTTLLGEYEVARSVLGLDDVTLASIARSSVEFSSVPPQVKQSALDGVARWLAAEPV